MMFWENSVGYLRNSECYSFQTFAIVFCTPENLLAEISGALGTKESTLSKLIHVFCEKHAVEYLRNIDCYSFQTFAIVFSTPGNLLVGISGALGTKESHAFSAKNDVLRKCSGVISETVNAGDLPNLCHCVLALHENLLVGISGALGLKEIHFLSKICFEKILWGISEMSEC